MDRRVSLSQQKRPSEASTNTEHEKEPKEEVTKHDEAVGTDDDFEPFLTRLEKCHSPPKSNKLAALSIKTLSPTNIIGSPTRFMTLSSKSVSPSSSKALSPSATITPIIKGGSPNSKGGSPNYKIGSPTIKVGSPDIRVASPNSKVGSPEIKVGSPVSKPGSPNSKTESPNTRSLDSGWQINLPLSPVESLEVIGENLLSKSPSPCKPSSPSSRPGSTIKPVSPASKPSSPPYKAGSPPIRIGSPISKPGSPTGKVGSPPGKVRTPPGKPVSPSQKLSSPFNKLGTSFTTTKCSGKFEVVKKVSPKVPTPKLSPREKIQREPTESIQSEPESACEGSLDIAKRETREATRLLEKRERPVLKRRSESESEVPAKRARVEDLSSSTGVSAGPTDHNLRSRDKPKEKGKETLVKRSSPVPSVDRPCTPTSRAAALEAKKLRQKLLLKGRWFSLAI